jgi:RNA polymerase sigma factor (sigma-70 family)
MDRPPMSDASQLSDQTRHRLVACLGKLASGDLSARDELIAIASERLRGIAHRMLRTFPAVRRWDETDDIVQNASMRLYRALADVVPQDARGFVGLAAVQVRRELLDLARKHAGPESQAAHHETAVKRVDGREVSNIESAADLSDPLDRLTTWTRLHEAAGSLPAEERELFHMVWYLGLKQDEIAPLLGISVRTVKRRWESAKSLLAEAVQGEKPA